MAFIMFAIGANLNLPHIKRFNSIPRDTTNNRTYVIRILLIGIHQHGGRAVTRKRSICRKDKYGQIHFFVQCDYLYMLISNGSGLSVQFYSNHDRNREGIAKDNNTK